MNMVQFTQLKSTSRHAALWRDDLTRPSVRPRKPRPWRDIAILACPPSPVHPTPTRSCSPPVVRPRPALACLTAHVSHAPGKIHNLIIIYRF